MSVLEEMIQEINPEDLEITRQEMIIEAYAIDRVHELLKDEIFGYKEKFYSMYCVTLSDAEDCYVKGYEDAYNRALKFIDEKNKDNFKKYMIDDLDNI